MLRPDRVRYCAWSVVAQCLFYFYTRPIITRLHPAQSFDEAEIERIARHITDFSLAAMKHYPSRAGAGGGRG